MLDWLPDWRDVLNLNLVNMLWTVPFFIGTICVVIHTIWTWPRWRATKSQQWIAATPEGRRSAQAAAFWFFRQDALNVVVGVAMTAGGVLAIVRMPHYAVGCLLVGAMAFMVNKMWNLYDDARIQSLIQHRRRVVRS